MYSHTMRRFIKLTSIIINTRHISHIDVLHNKYRIYLRNSTTNGFMFCTSGSIASRNEMVEVCETRHMSDYATVTEWIHATK